MTKVKRWFCDGFDLIAKAGLYYFVGEDKFIELDEEIFKLLVDRSEFELEYEELYNGDIVLANELLITKDKLKDTIDNDVEPYCLRWLADRGVPSIIVENEYSAGFLVKSTITAPFDYQELRFNDKPVDEITYGVVFEGKLYRGDIPDNIMYKVREIALELPENAWEKPKEFQLYSVDPQPSKASV
jgi:hypothetical protein